MLPLSHQSIYINSGIIRHYKVVLFALLDNRVLNSLEELFTMRVAAFIPSPECSTLWRGIHTASLYLLNSFFSMKSFGILFNSYLSIYLSISISIRILSVPIYKCINLLIPFLAKL